MTDPATALFLGHGAARVFSFVVRAPERRSRRRQASGRPRHLEPAQRWGLRVLEATPRVLLASAAAPPA